MIITMATRGWRVVQTHVPLIKFRKGATNEGRGGAAATSSAGSGASSRNPGPGASGPGAISLPTIQDFQLPPKFQRRPIDSREIEYINRGGPE